MCRSVGDDGCDEIDEDVEPFVLPKSSEEFVLTMCRVIRWGQRNLFESALFFLHISENSMIFNEIRVSPLLSTPDL